jgi:molybdopterin-containing oxidoreductase family membrane subunit
MWTAITLATTAIVLLLLPATRKNATILAPACATVIVSVWIDKGLGLIVPGFIPNPLGEVFEYMPTINEALIVLGVWAVGGLILTLLYKVVLGVRQE